MDLSGARCAGKYAKGPNIILNGVEYNNITEEKVLEILNSVKSA